MAVVAVSISLSAQSFNRLVVNISEQGKAKVGDELFFIESQDFTADFENSYDDMKMLNSNGMNIYAITAAGDQSKVYTNDIKGISIGVKAKAGITKYTISFDQIQDLTGAAWQFADYELGKIIDITATTTYDFELNSTEAVNDRFAIYKVFTADAGDLDICHENGTLVIKNNPYTENIIVKDYEDDSEKLNKLPRNTPQTISLASLAKDKQYKVVLGDGAKEMIIKVQ